MTQRILCLATVLGLLATGAPLTAGDPGNLLDVDGCDVLVLVEELPPGDHQGRWLMESIFTGKQYTYVFDGTSSVQVISPDFTSVQQTLYVNWRLEEIGARGTNRTQLTADLTQNPWTFDFDGQIIRGNRFPHGGIGGHGTTDPLTFAATYTEVTHVFCKAGFGGGGN